MEFFNTHTLISGLAIGGSFVSWLYGKKNYGWIYDAISNADDLDVNTEQCNGYYCIEGPLHSENPIIYNTDVKAFSSLHEETNTYIRLDETIYCILENSATQVEKDTVRIGYMANDINEQIRYVKDVKKSHTNTQIAYPITINNINIDEFVESIPLTYIDRIFKTQNEILNKGNDSSVALPKLSTKDLNSKLIFGFEFERQGVPIASPVTIFGWYDAGNKRMKRRRGKGIIHVVDFETEEDDIDIMNIKSKEKPIIVTYSSRSDVEEHYGRLKRKWNSISFGGFLLGATILGFRFLRK